MMVADINNNTTISQIILFLFEGDDTACSLINRKS